MKKILLLSAMLFTLCVVFGVQKTSAQTKGKVIYTQSAMTGVATLKGTLSKKKWMYFVLDFPDGKPAFNVVNSSNLSKFDYVLIKPDGNIATDILPSNSDKGAYRMKFKLKALWSNSKKNQSFTMEIWLE